MRVVWGIAGLALCFCLTASAQMCAPLPLSANGQVTGALAGSSCSLSDGTSYDAYRLVLPVRGQMQIALAPPADGSAPVQTAILEGPAGVQLGSGANIQMPVEAGTYTVLVNGAAAAYTLQTAFTAEPGMLCANFASLGLSQTVNGTLGASGCATPDGTPYEGYLVNTLGSGSLTATVSTTAFTPLVMVRDTDGALLGSGAGSVTVAVDSGSSYEVVVATSDTSGAYQLMTAFRAAAGETCLAAAAFNGQGNDQNAITPSSCSMIIDDSGDLAYYSFYTLNVSAAGMADIAANSTDFAPTLYLLDAGGNQLALDSGGGGAASSSEIRMQLNPGTYMVQVFSNYTSGGNYSLTYNFTAGAPAPCTTAQLTVGTTAAGNLGPASCRGILGLGDIYTLTLPASGTLTLDVLTGAFDAQVALRDTKDNLIVLNQDLEGLGDAHLAAALPAGSYTVAAASISGAGAYQLTSAFTAAAIPPCTFAQPLALNGGYIQNLGAGACTGANGYPVDLYQFTLPADGTIAGIMTSSELDGYLTLLDSSGNVLRSDDNSYADGDPMIVQFLKAGTYQLAARGASSTVGGLYEVSLLSSQGPRPVFCNPVGTLAMGASISGNLGFTGCQYVDGTFADVYQVTLAQATEIDLRMNSDDFDAFLVLEDAKGNVVATDDDSGGGTNSEIDMNLPAGSYFVYAKPFANYYSVGAYTVSLAQVQSQNQ